MTSAIAPTAIAPMRAEGTPVNKLKNGNKIASPTAASGTIVPFYDELASTGCKSKLSLIDL